jgi:tRNA(Arg) A34 adenosine deaminase TadA
VTDLPPPMRRALDLAWESTCAGSFGIGAVIADAAGEVRSTGRNRILESDPGDDLIAGSSIAHAEMNALAKLRYRAHEDDGLRLFTTLQPCIQCLGAIRLSSVRDVVVLAPDPLFRGIEEIVASHDFIGRNPPTIEHLPATPWTALALLLPTHLGLLWGSTPPGWRDGVPSVVALAEELVASGELLALAAARASLDDVADRFWPVLEPCVTELEALG